MTHSLRPFHYACLVLCSLLLSWSAHASDVVAQHYAAANAPSVQSVCTAGYDLLSGNVATSKPLIQGALPYVLSYNAPLRQNVSAAQNFTTPEHTNSGWSDNYQSYVQTRRIRTDSTTYDGLQYTLLGYAGGVPVYNISTNTPYSSSFIVDLITIRLPGETTDTVFKEQSGSFTRLYSADPVRDIRDNNVASLAWSSDLGEYQLSRATGSLVISKHGVQYSVLDASYSMGSTQVTQTDSINIYVDNQGYFQTTRNSWSGYDVTQNRASNTALYSTSQTSVSLTYRRISQVRSQGKTLNLSYDAQLNLTQVSDHLNNQLVFERTYNAAAQTDAESRLVTKVTYTSGTGIASQVANMTYQAFDSRMPRTGTLFQLYTLSAASSTASSQTNYQYALVQNGAVPLASRQAGLTADNTYSYPVLSEVKNALNQTQQSWEVTQNYVVSGSGSGSSYSTARTTLRSYGVSGNTTGNVADSTTIYDDVARSVQLTHSPNGVSQATTTVTTTINSNTDITLNITGAPCLVSGSTPIASMRVLTSRSQLQEVTDAKGVTSNIGYDSANRVTSVQQAVGRPEVRTTTYTYGALSNGAANSYNIPTTITKPYQTVTNVVNANGQITQQTQTSSQAGSTSKVTTYSYNTTTGLLSAVDGSLEGTIDRVTFAYDSYGNKSSESQVINGVTRRTQYRSYNSFGSPERIVYPNGLVDQFIYNADGTLQRKVHGVGGTAGNISGQTVSYTYDALKRVKTETSPDGEVTENDYDHLGRVIRITNPNGSITYKTYHPNGVVSAEVTKNSSGSVFLAAFQELDTNGRISRIRHSNYTSKYWERYQYDANGNKTQTSTPLGITNRWTYDALNRITSHTDGNGHTNTKSYDLQDNVTAAKDAVNSGSQPLEYINGQTLKKETNADFGIKTYSHDNADRITQVLHHVRQCSNNNIDGIGRIGGHTCVQSSTNQPLSSSYIHDYVYNYDGSRFGRLDSANSVNNLYGTDTSYTYDAYDRVIGKTQTVKAITAWNGTHPTRTVSYAYSSGGKLTGLTLPSGRQVQYVYDQGLPSRGQMQSISLDGSSLISSMSYNAAGQTTAWTWGNGSVYSISYDSSKNGNIKTITNSTASGVDNYKANHIFDDDGRITAITGQTTRDLYTYDNAGRLLTENRQYVSGQAAIFGITYTYDQNGNRLTLRTTGNHQQPASSVNYTYQANSNRLTSITRDGVVASPTHLTEGELRLDFAGGYDSYGQRRWSGRLNNDATQPQYYFAYNHKRERTVRSHHGSGGSWRHNSRQYMYDENSRLLGEYGWDGRVFVEYVWKGDVPIAAIYGQGSATKVYYIITDAQNTPRRLIDRSNDQVVWAWDSTAFGVAPPSVETVVFNLRFPGQYYDPITKQHYNLNRYYNPEIGRYMEADPIGLEGGLNPYAYAGSNPVMNVDPSGLSHFNFGDLSLPRDVSAAFFAPAIPSLPAWGGAALNFIGGLGLAAWDAIAPKPTDSPIRQNERITPSGIRLEIKDSQVDRFIFRGGNGNNSNLTPRVQDTGGLSYYLIPPTNENYTFTTLSAVNSTGVLRAVVDGRNHASVFPANPAMMAGWINSRPTANENPHQYTLIMQGISIKMKKGEMP